mmetsp:Transcript_805/g.1781  ORF Transcript_805/g.1781 Transcript_805/m.1781 type:complete len:294 (+) Transcript_805:438-1319(+)
MNNAHPRRRLWHGESLFRDSQNLSSQPPLRAEEFHALQKGQHVAHLHEPCLLRVHHGQHFPAGLVQISRPFLARAAVHRLFWKHLLQDANVAEVPVAQVPLEVVGLRTQQAAGNAANQTIVLQDRVAQIFENCLLVRERRVHEVTSTEGLIDAEGSALEQKVAGPSRRFFELRPLVAKRLENNGFGQQPVGLQAFCDLEEAEVTRFVNPQLSSQLLDELAECLAPLRKDPPCPAVDQQHLDRDGGLPAFTLNVSGRIQLNVEIGNALLSNHSNLNELWFARVFARGGTEQEGA